MASMAPWCRLDRVPPPVADIHLLASGDSTGRLQGPLTSVHGELGIVPFARGLVLLATGVGVSADSVLSTFTVHEFVLGNGHRIQAFGFGCYVSGVVGHLTPLFASDGSVKPQAALWDV